MNPLSLDDALNLIPLHDKLALLQASAMCPELVQQESPSLRFLEFEAYNYLNAARRLAKYWDMRLNLFGPERAFLPVLDFTGRGALRSELLDYVATGVAVILPPDDSNRPVLFSDRSRLPSDYLHWPNECRMMLAFALFQKIMLLSHDFVIVFLAANKPRFFPSISSFVADLLSQAMPLKPPKVYVVCRAPRSSVKSFIATYIPVILRLLNRNSMSFDITIEIGEKEDLLKKLLQNGLHPERLPESVGGTWTYDGFDDWFRGQRCRYSDSIFIPPSLQDNLTSEVQRLALSLEADNRPSAQLKMDDSIKNRKIDTVVEIETALVRGMDGTVPFQTDDIPQNIKAVILEVSNISFQEKSNYCEVLKVAPHLERTEAKLESFLLLENENPQTTARRVVSYWNFRKTLFKERSCLPLCQLEGYALNSEDLRTLKCGYITLLPKNQSSNKVICCDASRLEKDDPESRLRCLLYMLHVAGESSPSGCADDGVSILLVMNKLSYDRTCKQHGLADLLTVVPVKICSIHIIRQPARLGVALFDEKVVPTMKALLQPLKNIPVHAHCGSPSIDLREDLSSHGYETRNLPRSLGGGWSYQDFQEWREQRLIVERIALLERNRPSKGNSSSDHLVSGIVANPLVTTSALAPLLPLPLATASIVPTAPSPLEMQLNLLALQKHQQMKPTPQLLQTLLNSSSSTTTQNQFTSHGASIDGVPRDLYSKR